MESGAILQQRYRLLRSLGRGGMADVWLAFDEKRRAEVAVKVLREDLAEDPEFLRRFQREAEALARLDHPYIVRFYSLEREGSTAFIVMDYVAGTTLRAHLAEVGGPLPLAEVTSILRQVGPALQYAHSEGFVHRDIKPGNIMLRQDGVALLSDFGIAHAADAATTTHGALGTPAYMSPEQILGRHVDARTDVYCLGVVLYEMLTGRRPFVGDSGTGTSNTDRVRDEHLHRLPVDPRALNPALPPAVASLVLRAMAKDPAERWQSVSELVAAWPATASGTPSTPSLAGPAAAPRTPPALGGVASGPGRGSAAPAFVPPVPPSTGARVPTAGILAAAGIVAVALAALIAVGVLALRGSGREATTPVALLPSVVATADAASATAVSTPAAASQTPASPQDATVTPAPSPTATASPTPTLTPTIQSELEASGGEPIGTAGPTETATATNALLPTPTPTATPPPTPPCAVEPDAALAAMWDRPALGCAHGSASVVWSAWQSFQSGNMLWRSEPDTVSVLYAGGLYEEIYEKWDGVTVPPSRGVAPAGLYEPVRGFGYLWGTHDDIYSGLGWATAEEKGFCALVQQFDAGYLLRSSTVEFCQDALFNWARDPSFAPVAIRALYGGTWVGY